LRVISKSAIREFSEKRPDSLEPLLHWYRVAKNASWYRPSDVRADFGHADFVGDLTVFNIAGNKYRLVAAIKYRWQVVYVRDILTHADYTRGKWKQ